MIPELRFRLSSPKVNPRIPEYGAGGAGLLLPRAGLCDRGQPDGGVLGVGGGLHGAQPRVRAGPRPHPRHRHSNRLLLPGEMTRC